MISRVSYHVLLSPKINNRIAEPVQLRAIMLFWQLTTTETLKDAETARIPTDTIVIQVYVLCVIYCFVRDVMVSVVRECMLGIILW